MVVNRWKQCTGYAYKRETGERLWQQGFYDHVLRRDEDLLTVIAYLIANPVRAGLVASAMDYLYWGSGRWTRAELIEAIQSRDRRRAR